MSTDPSKGPVSGNYRDELEERRDSTLPAGSATSRPYRKTDRARPAKAPALAEPIIIAEFFANRRGETIRVQLRDFEGHTLLDVRKYFTGADGKLKPTKKGVAILVRRLPELAKAVAKAVIAAENFSLITTGDAP